MGSFIPLTVYPWYVPARFPRRTTFRWAELSFHADDVDEEAPNAAWSRSHRGKVRAFSVLFIVCWQSRRNRQVHGRSVDSTAWSLSSLAGQITTVPRASRGWTTQFLASRLARRAKNPRIIIRSHSADLLLHLVRPTLLLFLGEKARWNNARVKPASHTKGNRFFIVIVIVYVITLLFDCDWINLLTAYVFVCCHWLNMWCQYGLS